MFIEFLLRGALISFVQIAALASGKKSFCTLQGTLLDKNGSVPLLKYYIVLTATVCFQGNHHGGLPEHK